MQIPQGPHNVRRRMVALDGEIAAVVREMEQAKAAGQSTGQLALRLDDLRRQRGLLEFYKDEGPIATEPKATPIGAQAAPQKSRAGIVVGCTLLLLIGLVVGGVLVGVLAMSSDEPAERDVDVVAIEPQPAKPVVAAEPTSATPAAASKVTLQWRATVKSASGLRLSPGSDCKLEADLLRTSDGKHQIRPTVQCGLVSLYRWNEPVKGGTRQLQTQFVEAVGREPATWEYAIKYSDHGDRETPPQLTIDTQEGIIALSKLQAPAFQVELQVEPLALWRGQPLLPMDMKSPLELDGPQQTFWTVTTASGQAAAEVGDYCDVTITAGDTSYNCRIQVRCNGQTIYGDGNAGYNNCLVKQDAPVMAHDDSASNGDPIFWMNLPAGLIRVSDDQPGQQFTVHLQLPRADAGAAPGAAAPPAPPAPSPAAPTGQPLPPGTVPRAPAPAAPKPPPPAPAPVEHSPY